MLTGKTALELAEHGKNDDAHAMMTVFRDAYIKFDVFGYFQAPHKAELSHHYTHITRLRSRLGSVRA